MLEPHMALFVAPTGVGKTHLALDLLERSTSVISISSLSFVPPCDAMKCTRVKSGFGLILVCNCLHDWIEKIGNLLAGSKTLLFLIDDIITNETLNKQMQPLLDLAISGRHKGHSLWLLTQSYTAVPLNIRRQAKMLHVWYLKK